MSYLRRWALPGALALIVFATGCSRQEPTTSALNRPNQQQAQQTTAQSQDQATTPSMNDARKTPGEPATTASRSAPARTGAARPQPELGDSVPATGGVSADQRPPSRNTSRQSSQNVTGTNIPAGTAISVRTTDRISTKGATAAGDRWYGSLEAPIQVDGRTIAPRGSRVVGEVTNADDGGRVKGRASISVQVLSVETPGGQSVPIRTESFTAVANSGKKSDAAKIGIGAGIGAAIGAIAGGGKGAAIGAASGGAAGTGVVLATGGADAVIPAETVLNLRTAQTVTVR